MPESNQRVQQQSGNDKENGEGDRKHQHREVEDRMRRRRGRSEDVRGRLRRRDARKKRQETHCHPEGMPGVEPDPSIPCHRSSWEEKQNSPTSTSASVDDADKRHAPAVMLNHQRWLSRESVESAGTCGVRVARFDSIEAQWLCIPKRVISDVPDTMSPAIQEMRPRVSFTD